MFTQGISPRFEKKDNDDILGKINSRPDRKHPEKHQSGRKIQYAFNRKAELESSTGKLEHP